MKNDLRCSNERVFRIRTGAKVGAIAEARVLIHIFNSLGSADAKDTTTIVLSSVGKSKK